MPDPILTVFVIDDDEDIRKSLQRALEKRGYAVESHASAASFLAGFDPRRAGCLVLDYGMPDMNGLELQSHLNQRGATIPVIFITGHGGVPESVQAIKAGALDFLEKPFRQGDLVERIETAFAIARDRLARDEQARRQRARFERLTAREQEIVARMIDRPSEISSKELAAALGISPRTVDHHRARILEKMNVKSVAELIALAGK
ncbi:two component transcriptional regulator, LuxR family [Paracoccus aminovorans]|uniref:Two component transcriptional regulator, LuxR family n=1 Tax=Paracoccus aminovorans TaxID=34004 RepID=A0A1I3AAA2_9RHOB|nr:response regulator [Paracoccus aminovorans]CQR83830.1 two-component transcriptional regulator, LuxR family Translation product 203 aas [Paracoccus aminovorans]SFH46669.1 two component transcriptional regulator, LuxR family [Paracoccus aminovorans]